MTAQHSFAYIETDIAEGLTISDYRRARPPRRRKSLRAHWRLVSGVVRGR
jgi:hypothetical protein